MAKQKYPDEFAARLAAATLSTAVPSEPNFLKPYSEDRHEACLGPISLELQHIYLLGVALVEELSEEPESNRLLKQYLLARQHFCTEVRDYFKIDALHDQEFEVCQGFVVCLKRYEVDGEPLSENDVRLFQALEDVIEGCVTRVL